MLIRVILKMDVATCVFQFEVLVELILHLEKSFTRPCQWCI